MRLEALFIAPTDPFISCAINGGINDPNVSTLLVLGDDSSFLIFFNIRGVVESASTGVPPLLAVPLAAFDFRVAGIELGNRMEKQ